jgi:hypothetical protein
MTSAEGMGELSTQRATRSTASAATDLLVTYAYHVDIFTFANERLIYEGRADGGNVG